MTPNTTNHLGHNADDATFALWETAHRWVAYVNAIIAAGPHPDPDTTLALLELQVATDSWRDRFIAALERRGLTVDQVLVAA